MQDQIASITQKVHAMEKHNAELKVKFDEAILNKHHHIPLSFDLAAHGLPLGSYNEIMQFEEKLKVPDFKKEMVSSNTFSN